MSLGYPEEKPITLSQGTTAFVPPQLELPPGMTWETVREKSKEKAPEFAQVESKKIKYTFEPVHLPLPPGVEESEQAKKRRQERPVVFALKPISEIKAWKPPTVEPLAPVPVVPAPVVPIPVPAPVVKPKTGTGTLVHMKPNTTPQEFRDIVMSNKPVFIKYTAEWCGYCKQAKPTFVRLADRYKEYQFYEFDIEENEKLLKYSNVWKDGKVIKAYQGSMDFEPVVISHIVEYESTQKK